MSTAEVESLTNFVREHSSAVIRYAAATAKRMGLEASELSALEHLQAAVPMTLGQLGERLSMSPGAVTALVDRLEKAPVAVHRGDEGHRGKLLGRGA